MDQGSIQFRIRIIFASSVWLIDAEYALLWMFYFIIAPDMHPLIVIPGAACNIQTIVVAVVDIPNADSFVGRVLRDSIGRPLIRSGWVFRDGNAVDAIVAGDDEFERAARNDLCFFKSLATHMLVFDMFDIKCRA